MTAACSAATSVAAMVEWTVWMSVLRLAVSKAGHSAAMMALVMADCWAVWWDEILVDSWVDEKAGVKVLNLAEH